MIKIPRDFEKYKPYLLRNPPPPVGNRELLLILLSKLLPKTFDFKDMAIKQLLAKKNLKFFLGVPPSGPLDQRSP